jgi:uncharacterized protein (DUF1810 family)
MAATLSRLRSGEQHEGMSDADEYDLNRFLTAQDSGRTYETALGELHRGSKRSHWMWFVFPQISGLGHSPTAIRYGISGLDEARAYLAHPVLGPRLLACVDALTSLESSDPLAVLGGIDAMKLRSSMTLFVHAAEDEVTRRRFQAVLDQYFGGHEDPQTLARL